MPPEPARPSGRRPSPADPPSPTGMMFRAAVLPAAAAGMIAAAVFWIARGPSSALSGVLGVVIGVAFFASSLVLLSPRFRRWEPVLAFAVALTLYGTQVFALLVVYELTGGLTWLDGVAVGVAILVATLVFQAFAVRAWRRARTPIYDEIDQHNR